jgi:hypothetical protein
VLELSIVVVVLGLYSRVQDFEDGFQFFFVRNICLFCTSDIAV